RMVVDVVGSLSEHLDEFDYSRWLEEWKSADNATAVATEQNNSPSIAPGHEETVRPEEYPTRILGRWLGPRKYLTFFADGSWGIQRNEEAPIEIEKRRWRIEGNTLFLTFPGGDDYVTGESKIISFKVRQFTLEDQGKRKTFDWAP